MHRVMSRIDCHGEILCTVSEIQKWKSQLHLGENFVPVIRENVSPLPSQRPINVQCAEVFKELLMTIIVHIYFHITCHVVCTKEAPKVSLKSLKLQSSKMFSPTHK